MSGDKSLFCLYLPRPCMASMQGEYAALSYCWGDDEADFKLTKTGIVPKQSVIPLSALPKTLQDAINITRTLQFPDLWIDALCIVQESKDDWEKEAAMMGEVYSNATLTIAAAGATKSSDGIFRPRDIFEYTSPQLRFRSPSGEKGYAFLRYRPGYADDGKEPLESRGWTLQERLLSPRLLSYNRHQLSWECQSVVYSKGNPVSR